MAPGTVTLHAISRKQFPFVQLLQFYFLFVPEVLIRNCTGTPGQRTTSGNQAHATFICSLIAVADLRGRSRRPPPMDQNFFNFMRFFGECVKYIRSVPPSKGLAPPPTTSPGSAQGFRMLSLSIKPKYLSICVKKILGMSVCLSVLSNTTGPDGLKVHSHRSTPLLSP